MRYRILTAAWLWLAAVMPLAAAEIRGEIGAVDDKGVAVIISGGFEPQPGDKFVVLVEVPGVGEASMAQGQVNAIDDGIVIGKIVAATGKVAVGQKVKIDSPQAVRKRPAPAPPEPILGKIGAVVDKEITIVTTSQVDPAVGDKVEVFVEVPGTGAASVGVGKVTALQRGLITARIEQATGKLVFGQQVRIISTNPPPAAATAGEVPNPTAGSAPAVWLGLAVENLRDDVRIETVIPGSPAARAGFRSDDRLKTLDGEEVLDFVLFTRAVSSGAAGKSRRVEVARGDERLTFELLPEPRPSNEQLFARMQKLAEAGDHDAQYELAVMYKEGRGIPDPDAVAARRWMRSAAQAGVAVAQSGYGEYLVNGTGGEKNLPEGIEWIKKAAEKRWPSSVLNMGQIYRLGLGVEKHKAEARHWYGRALKLGSLNTLVEMGELYEHGELYEKDPQKAAEFYRTAAQRGFPPAQAAWGRCLLRGIGVEQDHQAAERWLRTASEAGDPRGHLVLGNMYFEGQGVAQDREAALNLFRKAAALGNETALYKLGVVYRDGLGVQADDEESYRWFRAAADREFVAAYAQLGLMNANGRGVPQSNEQAVLWFRKSAESGDALGQYNLSVMYSGGRGIEKSDSEALKWCQKAALQKFPEAECGMGVIAMEGLGVKKDLETAFAWFKAGANHGNAKAQYNLGFLYENGQGVARNPSEAIDWYERAAAQNNTQSIDALKRLGRR